MPPQEEFMRDVRRAAGWLQEPTVLTSGAQLASGETYAKIIQQAHLWLTPKVVAAYAPEHFANWPPETQRTLQHCVEGFREAAEAVPADALPTKEQYETGRAAFEQVLTVVGDAVLEEWQQAVEKLVATVESWSKEMGWPTRRVNKNMFETLLGKYSPPQLQIYAQQHLYVLDPLARFVPGAKGAVDLSIQPSYFVTSLYRDHDDSWHIHLDVEKGARGSRKALFSKESFSQAIEELKALL